MQTTLLIRDTEVKVTDVLRLIVQGFSYPQILTTYPDLVTSDIQAAAKLALTFIEQYVTSEDNLRLDHVVEITANNGKLVNLSKVREQHPRAFMPWKTSEDTRLIEAFRAGARIEDIAKAHQRNYAAIKKRLEKLGLTRGNNATT